MKLKSHPSIDNRIRRSPFFIKNIGVSAALICLAGCGQGPSFLKTGSVSHESSTSTSGGDATAADGTMDNDFDGQSRAMGAGTVAGSTGDPIQDGLNAEKGITGGGTSTLPDDSHGNPQPEPLPTVIPDPGNDHPTPNPPPPPPPYPTIPGASDSDLSALHKCMDKWKTYPWKDTVPTFKKIYASINIGGFGTPLKDTERTVQPELVLVYASVNVNSTVDWELMNPNGFYCVKVGVNTKTDLTINLHCNARLADSAVEVNVGSTVSDTSAAVGVNVLSTVDVNTIRPVGDQCIR